jgi:uncharacterized protein (TIGR02757 family)
MVNLKNYLDDCLHKFNNRDFIKNDPLSIPHRFSKKQDIEITAFWTAMLAWGQRKTIINSATRLFDLMDNAPHDFIVNHQETDRRRFLDFKHRTFQATDTLYFLEFLQQYYRQYCSLELAFTQFLSSPTAHPTDFDTIEPALMGFHPFFFSLPDAPQRTRKHVPTPTSKSTCKRLCMFLRWMVRHDAQGVDFGIWQNLKPAQLLMPLDVHVERHARRLGLLTRPRTDWQAVLELTQALRVFDPDDPVKYDFALFGLGIMPPAEFFDSAQRSHKVSDTFEAVHTP